MSRHYSSFYNACFHYYILHILLTLFQYYFQVSGLVCCILSIISFYTQKSFSFYHLKGDIEALFPNANVWEDPDADYFYCAEIKKQHLSAVIGNMLLNIEYDNFKKSINHDSVVNRLRLKAAHEIWEIMYKAQNRILRCRNKFVWEEGDLQIEKE